MVQISNSGRAQRRSLTPLRREVYRSSLTSVLTARFDFVVTMFAEGKIDTKIPSIVCDLLPSKVLYISEDSSSSFNLGQLTKRIHGKSDELD